MKYLHREDLFTWSEFNAERNIDFNSTLWVRKEGNILIDPLPLTPHDLNHLKELGGASWIIVTNSDHLRDAKNIRDITGAKLAGPQGEKDSLGFPFDRYLTGGDELVPGLKTVELQGSKTPGELCFVLDDTTLITGDLLRCHKPNCLMILPKQKIIDIENVKSSLSYLLEFQAINSIIVGDGWNILNNGYQHIKNLVEQLNN